VQNFFSVSIFWSTFSLCLYFFWSLGFTLSCKILFRERSG